MASSRRSSSSGVAGNNEIERQLNDLLIEDGVEAVQRSGQIEGDDESGTENVLVMVRCRPLLSSERLSSSVIKVNEADRSLQVKDERQFKFDRVFGPETNSEQVYMQSVRRLVEWAFHGFNCTIFLYGQTGTGKTYTHSSLMLSAFEHLFSLIQSSDKQSRFLIRASYYELYNEEIRDLLADSGGRGSGRRRQRRSSSSVTLELHESKERGVFIKNLTCFLVNNLNELVKLKQLGDKRRATAATRMNQHSSRSHSIFSIAIETTTNLLIDEAPARNKSNSKQGTASSLRLGRLHLIDLAGSERQSKSGSLGLQLREASQINLSLTCLSLVIRALTDKNKSSAHIPYRNSKLTRLLSSSLGGNSKTLLLACISPAESNLDETLNTLRFAARTKQIKNKAVINEDPKDALLRKYRNQLEELRAKLKGTQQQQAADGLTSTNSRDDTSTNSERENPNKELMQQLDLLKAKIMFGGENLLDKMELHERLLKAGQEELEERRRAEAKLRQELRNKEHSLKSVTHSKGSLQSQRAYLDEKLAKAVELYKQSKLDLRDLSSEHERLKEQLLVNIKSTSREIKYTDCILDDFIPREYLDLINAYAQYDDESDEWQIKYIASSGNNITQTRRLAISNSNTPLVGQSQIVKC